MSRSQTLRALVNERLAAAAEDIFVLFERTIAEYEEELCRSKEENQRKQQLMDKILSKSIELHKRIPSATPGLGLNEEITETEEDSKEQSVKQEEEQLPVPVSESSAVQKTEESSLLQQIQTEHREETQEEDISSEPRVHSEAEENSQHVPYSDWAPFSWSITPTETEAAGAHCSSVQRKSTPETTVHSENMSGAYEGGAERKKYQCLFCNKRFSTKRYLEEHIRNHTGERPYICSICEKSFTQKRNLDSHKKIHSGEKPYRCLTCDKAFAQKCSLESHARTHTGEKPYICKVCHRTFAQKSSLGFHIRTHTGEKPYNCPVCDKTFSQKRTLDSHVRTHTEETLQQFNL